MVTHSFPASRPEPLEHLPGWLSMSARDEKSVSAKKSRKRGDDAFEIWLRRGLHQLFDDVAKEPVPEELLKIIEEDRDS